MKGKEAIIQKIIGDAKKAASSTMEEAGVNADEILNIARNDAKIYKDRHMSESFSEREEIIKRKISMANLEARKMLLQEKQKIIEKSFEKAVEKIRDDKEKYVELIINMLTFAENGDTVVISEKDKDIITEEFILAEAKKKKIKVNISKKYGAFSGGIILSGTESDKNFSLEVELAHLRSVAEPEIAKIMFGE